MKISSTTNKLSLPSLSYIIFYHLHLISPKYLLMQSLTHKSYIKLKPSKIIEKNQLMYYAKKKKLKLKNDSLEEEKINKIIETSPSIVEVVLDVNWSWGVSPKIQNNMCASQLLYTNFKNHEC